VDRHDRDDQDRLLGIGGLESSEAKLVVLTDDPARHRDEDHTDRRARDHPARPTYKPFEQERAACREHESRCGRI
jgi:hypothetical protein